LICQYAVNRVIVHILHLFAINWTELISVALVHKWTMLTKRPPLVGEVSTNFCGQRGVAWSA
jgi:hypothetical protein